MTSIKVCLPFTVKCKVLSIDKKNPSSNIATYSVDTIKNKDLFTINSKINLNSAVRFFANCDILDNLKEFITSSNAPYGIHRTREQRFFEEPKLICKGMFLTPEFYYDEDKFYCGFSFSVIIQKSNEYDLKLLLALMNSKVGDYWFKQNGRRMK